MEHVCVEAAESRNRVEVVEVKVNPFGVEKEGLSG